jgi:hypothetical protein
MPVVTNQPLPQVYLIVDIAAVLLTYNRIRWYRGREGANGAFEAATSATVQPASLLGTALTPHQLNGKTLKLRVNGITDVDVLFSDADPVTSAQAATAIDAASVLITAADEGGKVRITTVATGTGASLEVLEGDAAPYLGFLTGVASVGLGADVALSSGIHEYAFTDQNSSSDFYYKAELRNSATSAVSPLSIALPSTRPDAVPYAETIACYIRLAGHDGKPLCRRTISVHNINMPNSVTSGPLLWGIFRNSISMQTDTSGMATTRLIRGSVVDISVVGAGFTRRVTIPDTGDLVDLLDPSLATDDEFEIQEFNVDFAIRTS